LATPLLKVVKEEWAVVKKAVVEVVVEVGVREVVVALGQQ
jgi:hypothetical protein